MTTIIYALAGSGILVVSAAVLFIFLSIGKREKIPAIAPADLKTMIERNDVEYYLLDLRDRNDYKKGHIPGAVNIPLKEIGSFYPTEKMFTDIIVCGRTDREAQAGAKILSDTAYFRVKSLGAVARWKESLETGKGTDYKKLIKER